METLLGRFYTEVSDSGAITTALQSSPYGSDQINMLQGKCLNFVAPDQFRFDYIF